MALPFFAKGRARFAKTDGSAGKVGNKARGEKRFGEKGGVTDPWGSSENLGKLTL